MYGAGVRVSEAVHLRATDIDSQRMTIRIEQGKRAEGPLGATIPQTARSAAHVLA